MQSAQGVAEMGCARRVNLGPFTVFVATFVPRGARYHHGHDDLLSYVVYCEGDDVLCDPGLPSYMSEDRSYARSDVHNGLCSTLPLRMPATPFVPGGFAVPTTRFQCSQNAAEVEASSNAFGGWKRMSFQRDGSDLVIRERVLAHAANAASFSHCLASDAARLASDVSVACGQFELTYEGLHSLRLESAYRSVDYGQRLPCARLTGHSPSASTVTRIRHV